MDAFHVPRRRFLALGGAAAAGLTVSACSTDGRKEREGGALVVGTPPLPGVLNPLLAEGELARWSTAPAVETLYEYRTDTTMRPILAVSNPMVSSDGLTWTVRIREGITFHNGDAFNAEHVAAVLRRVGDQAAAGGWNAYLGGRISDAVAPDARTVKITLPKPFGILRELLTCVPMLHKNFLNDPKALMATGPYQVASWKVGETLTLQKWAGYRDKSANLDSIEFRATADSAARQADLKAKTIGIDVRISPGDVRTLSRVKGLETHAVTAPVDLLVLPNATRAPFADVAARRALAYGMDRRRVRDTVYNGLATLGQGPCGPAVEGWDNDFKPYDQTADPERVRVLLGEAGLTGAPVRCGMIVESGSAELEATARTLAEGWGKLGFAVAVDLLPPDVFAERRRRRDYDLALIHNRTATSVGRTALTALGLGRSDNPDGPGYKNAEFNRLIEEAWAADRTVRRVELCGLANEIMLRDAVLLPPVYPKLLTAQTSRVEGVSEDRMSYGLLDLAQLHLRS
jgi:ABC-type transport system substrate-binding protein